MKHWLEVGYKMDASKVVFVNFTGSSKRSSRRRLCPIRPSFHKMVIRIFKILLRIFRVCLTILQTLIVIGLHFLLISSQTPEPFNLQSSDIFVVLLTSCTPFCDPTQSYMMNVNNFFQKQQFIHAFQNSKIAQNSQENIYVGVSFQ